MGLPHWRRCNHTNISEVTPKNVGYGSHEPIENWTYHYSDVTMDAIASQITSLTIVYSTVYSDADQRKHQSSASPAFVRGIHREPVNSPHKWPVTRKMFPFDGVIMQNSMHIKPLAYFKDRIVYTNIFSAMYENKLVMLYQYCFYVTHGKGSENMG